MKRFLISFALFLSVSAFACGSDIPSGPYFIKGALVPYISHVNGQVVCSVTAEATAGTIRFTQAPTSVSTNGPFTIRVSAARSVFADSSYMFFPFGVVLITGGDTSILESHIALTLSYSINNGASVTIGQRLFVDSGVGSLSGTLWRDVTISANSGDSITFCLSVGPIGASYYKQFAFDQLSFSKMFYDDGVNGAYEIGQELTDLTTAIQHSVTITVGGLQRPGRSK